MLSKVLSELSPVQWIFIGLGLLIMLPTLLEWLSKAKVVASDKLGSISTPVSGPKLKSVTNTNSLTSIVSKWECLYEACQEAKLETACSKIEEVFPLLTKKSIKEEKPDKAFDTL